MTDLHINFPSPISYTLSDTCFTIYDKQNDYKKKDNLLP
jgi:hypothetical protein